MWKFCRGFTLVARFPVRNHNLSRMFSLPGESPIALWRLNLRVRLSFTYSLQHVFDLGLIKALPMLNVLWPRKDVKVPDGS